MNRGCPSLIVSGVLLQEVHRSSQGLSWTYILGIHIVLSLCLLAFCDPDVVLEWVPSLFAY